MNNSCNSLLITLLIILLTIYQHLTNIISFAWKSLIMKPLLRESGIMLLYNNIASVLYSIIFMCLFSALTKYVELCLQSEKNAIWSNARHTVS